MYALYLNNYLEMTFWFSSLRFKRWLLLTKRFLSHTDYIPTLSFKL